MPTAPFLRSLARSAVIVLTMAAGGCLDAGAAEDLPGAPPLAAAFDEGMGLPSFGLKDVVDPSWPEAAPDGVSPRLQEVEDIDPLTGLLRLRVPLGARYPLGPRLSYRVHLVYRSDALERRDSLQAPSPAGNAGLGWQLHFGHLWPEDSGGGAWVYLSPDGERHRLSPLPARAPRGGREGAAAYSADSSRLRLQRLAGEILVEAPDGTVSVFERLSPSGKTPGCGDGPGECWRFRERRDLYGNRLWIDYSGEEGEEVWTIHDSTGRHHVLTFRREAADPELPRRLERVDLAAFGGERAIYELLYDEGEPHRARGAPLLRRIKVPGGKDFEFLTSTAGRLVELTLPAGSRAAYDYGPWPADCSSPPEAGSIGILRRKLRLPGGPVAALWTYRPRRLPESPCGGVLEVTVDGPAADGTFPRRVFFKPTGSIPLDEPFLVETTFDCLVRRGCGEERRRRSVFVRHAAGERGPRLVARRTVFHDDGDRFVKEERSHFDDAGIPLRRRWSDDFNGGLRVLEEELETAPLPSPEEPWVLSSIRQRRRTLGKVTRVEEWGYDRAGLPVCRRAWRNAQGRGERDVVVRWDRGLTPGVDAGLVVREIRAGGDTGRLATDVLCPTSGNVRRGSRLVREHRYQHLVPSSRSAVDRNTGLPLRRKERSGEVTAYAFDLQGRLLGVSPEAGLELAKGTLKYRSPAGGPLSVDVTTTDGGELLDRRVLGLDAFARPRQLRWLRPQGSGDPELFTAEVVYGPLGHRRRFTPSSPAAEDPGEFDVLWSRHDPYGRPRRIQTAGGEDLRIDDSGLRRRSVTLPVRTEGNAFEEVRLSWRFDPWGRPEAVIGPRLATRARRGPDGEILEISRRAAPPTPAEAQHRLFRRDGRGFLAEESHPELEAVTGEGAAILWRRDALGRALERRDGASTLRLELDPRGRRGRLRADGELLAERLWGTVHLPGDARQGRPVRDTRWSTDGAGTSWRIRHTDSHGTSRGGLVFRRTEILGAEGGSAAFEQSWTPGPGGGAESWTYPRAVDPPTVAPRTSVTTEHRGGRPVRLRSSSGATAELFYLPDGRIHRGRLGDGSRLLRTVPGPGRQRLRVQDAAGHGLYDSGSIHEDPFGFRFREGPVRYVFDDEGRLVLAALRRICKGCRQEHAYDAFDNLTNVYRDDRFDWWLSVDERNRLVKPPGDDAGRVSYDGAGRVSELGWSWPDPPPALQSLTLGYDGAGTLIRVRAGPYRDWQLVPGPDGRPAVVYDRVTGSARLALRDLEGRPLAVFEARLSQTSPAWNLARELLYGPEGLLAETLPGEAPRYVLPSQYYPYGFRPAPDEEIFSPAFAGHEQLPEGLTLDPRGQPYSPLLLRFLVPGRVAGIWNLYGLAPPQQGGQVRAAGPSGPGQPLELRQQRIWGLLAEEEDEGLDLPMALDGGELPVEEPP